MKKFLTFLSVIVFSATAGYGEDAVEHIGSILKQSGIYQGFDSDRKAIVQIGSYRISMTNGIDSLDEAKRFEAAEGAFLRAMKDIAVQLRTVKEYHGKKDDHVTDKTELRTKVNLPVKGIKVLAQSESFRPFGKGGDSWEYESAVAVAWSEKLQQAAEKTLVGRIEEIPKFRSEGSLEEWMQKRDLISMLGVRTVFDSPNHYWILGIASQDEDGLEGDGSVARARAAYAVECALGGDVTASSSVRLCNVRWRNRTVTVAGVSHRKSHSSGMWRRERSVSHHRYWFKSESITESIEMKPFLQFSPIAQRVRWFEHRVTNPLTGKTVRVVVAAIDSNDIPSFMRNSSSNVFGESQQETSISAIEQAKKFIEQEGWRTGREFLKTSRFAVAIGGAVFKYTSSMDGAAFAQKRNDAVRQALMESVMNVAFTFGCRGELKMSLSSGDSKMQQSYVADDEAVERIVRDGISFCDDSDVVVDLKNQGFKWRASFSSLSAESSESERKSVKKVEGRVKSEMPILGLKVERQFESIVDGVYQIAFVVTCNPKRGRDIMLSSDNWQWRDEWGKLPLGQWIAEQDFGMVAGPRQYVDDKGNVWMIGIVPAAEGCRPFGSSLDGMAREYAAFGLSGDVKASYEMSSLKSSSGEYSERKAEILYSAESSPTGKYYPKEFELVFHRAFTHSLTGRRGEVSICALRLGKKELVDKLTAEQVKENLTRAKELKRKKGIRDSLLKKREGQFNEDHQ